tara:strand:+ start:206 stop:937 length:732 start_codon:yes stop_codon:yes gene_type:complete
MAIGIDNVYQQVLAIANKEQRGYITPQEFNLLARKAQLDIFEEYFHDIKNKGIGPDSSDEYGGSIDNLKEKVAVFEKWKVAMSAVSGNDCTLPTSSTVHKLGTVFYAAGSFDVVVDRVEKNDLHYMERNPKTKYTDRRPVYVRKTNNVIKVFPPSPTVSYTTSNVTCNFIARPADPKWTYVVVGDKALYNGSDAGLQDFELHASEESTLVNKILELAGIAIESPGLSELVLRNESLKEAKENR